MTGLPDWGKIIDPLKDKPEALIGALSIIGTVWIIQAGVKDWLINLVPIAIFVLYCVTRIAMALHTERLRKLDVKEIEVKGSTRIAEINARRLAAKERKAR